MTLLPAVMGLCGSRNWALPSWLDRVLPHLSMEGPATETPEMPPARRAPKPTAADYRDWRRRG